MRILNGSHCGGHDAVQDAGWPMDEVLQLDIARGVFGTAIAICALTTRSCVCGYVSALWHV